MLNPDAMLNLHRKTQKSAKFCRRKSAEPYPFVFGRREEEFGGHGTRYQYRRQGGEQHFVKVR